MAALEKEALLRDMLGTLFLRGSQQGTLLTAHCILCGSGDCHMFGVDSLPIVVHAHDLEEVFHCIRFTTVLVKKCLACRIFWLGIPGDHHIANVPF